MSELFVVVFNAMFVKNEVRLFQVGVKSLFILSGSTARGIKKFKLMIVAIKVAILINTQYTILSVLNSFG